MLCFYSCFFLTVQSISSFFNFSFKMPSQMERNWRKNKGNKGLQALTVKEIQLRTGWKNITAWTSKAYCTYCVLCVESCKCSQHKHQVLVSFPYNQRQNAFSRLSVSPPAVASTNHNALQSQKTCYLSDRYHCHNPKRKYKSLLIYLWFLDHCFQHLQCLSF